MISLSRHRLPHNNLLAINRHLISVPGFAIPTKMTTPKTTMPCDHGYIVKGYREEQAGQLIEESQVVRANNGRFYLQDENITFRILSRACCPTYETVLCVLGRAH